MEYDLNTIKTTFLLAVMTSFFIFIGQIVGGQSGMLIAFIFAAVMNIASYWYSDKIVLKLNSNWILQFDDVISWIGIRYRIAFSTVYV